MAEVLGAVASGLTVASLFKLCIEAFDLIQIARNQDTDVQKSILRLNIERCRLWVWGETMGLTVPQNSGQTRPLESSQFYGLVCDTLQAILDTFRDTQKMKEQYGCKKMSTVHDRKRSLPQTSCRDPVKNLAATFSDFTIAETTLSKPSNSVLQTRWEQLTSSTRWVIHDRKRFLELIKDAKTLIDGLQEITKPLSTVARQEGVMRYGIQQVTDVDTLQLVADVSQKDYPDMSDAAFIKVDVLTIATNQRVAIEAWADLAGINSDDETSDIESMTITELKHRLRFAVAGRLPSGASHADRTIPSDQPPNKVSPNAKGSSDAPKDRPSHLPTPELDAIVLEYLAKRGYKTSEATLRVEAKVKRNSVQPESLSQPQNELEQLVSTRTIQGGDGHGHHYETRQSKRLRTTGSAETRHWRP